ncbi:MAG: hypothetical protein RM049_37225 [Nostoc sp. DedQUE04]|uniref:hypothetical protein n=1 Tax=Nostoc sp. DedQUE04 TaxID=3075390 RepID=UPI002AD2238C|nr:hypothetical protein [Nostoc sp. DedQUE04]MDZ8140872.1 hypothetical protein [Nostoc sp. DedQUE04]
MHRSYTTWLVTVVLAFIGFGLDVKSAIAQQLYTFNATYDVFSTSKPITPDVSATTISGQSIDAPYDLTKVSGLTYSQINFATGEFRFNTDAATFGLQGLPVGEIVLFGNGSNKLFGTNNATGVIDFLSSKGTATNIFTITSGEGLFLGAVGTLTLREVYQISLDPNIPTTGKSKASGTIQVFSKNIPEPSTTNASALIGMMGVAFWLRRQRNTPTL